MGADFGLPFINRLYCWILQQLRRYQFNEGLTPNELKQKFYLNTNPRRLLLDHFNAYNCVQKVKGTFESVIMQTYESLEVIVIDDRYSDGATSVVSGIRDECIRVITLTNL